MHLHRLSSTSCHCSATSCCIVAVSARLRRADHCPATAAHRKSLHPPLSPAARRRRGERLDCQPVWGRGLTHTHTHTLGGFGLKGAIIQRAQWALCAAGPGGRWAEGRVGQQHPVIMFFNRRNYKHGRGRRCFYSGKPNPNSK